MRHLPIPLLLAGLPALLAAAVVEDFTVAPELTLVEASTRGTGAAVEAFPADGNPALVVRLAERHGTMHEVYLFGGKPQSGPATVAVRARRSGAFQMWSLTLRVRDAKGETFQFSGSALPGDDWTRIVYTVDQAHEQGHWGAPGTGILDGPWRVAGFAVLGNENPGAGEVWIDEVSCEMATSP